MAKKPDDIPRCGSTDTKSGRPCRRRTNGGPCDSHDETGLDTLQQQKDRFVTALETESLGTVKRACQAINVSRQTVHNWAKTDAVFRARWEEAVENDTDDAVEFGMKVARGWYEPVFHAGQLVLWPDDYQGVDHNGQPCAGQPVMQLKYDSSMLQFMLKSRRPNEYRESIDIELADSRIPEEDNALVLAFATPGGYAEIAAASKRIREQAGSAVIEASYSVDE